MCVCVFLSVCVCARLPREERRERQRGVEEKYQAKRAAYINKYKRGGSGAGGSGKGEERDDDSSYVDV